MAVYGVVSKLFLEMKKVLYSILLFTAVLGVLSACNNGDYNSNLSSNANGSINPLNPLKIDEFTWGGNDPMSADINGSHWVADAAYFQLDTFGRNLIIGIKGPQMMAFILNDVWSNNLYNMGYKVEKRMGMYFAGVDSTMAASGDLWGVVGGSSTANSAVVFTSYLGNSGEIKMVENDSVRIKGQFYFQAVNSSGAVMNITNGYFNVAKPY